ARRIARWPGRRRRRQRRADLHRHDGLRQARPDHGPCEEIRARDPGFPAWQGRAGRRLQPREDPARLESGHAMPSFDTVSELDVHELTNAVDQANRELTQRFDFKDSGASFELKEKEFTVSLKAPAEFQLRQ